MTATEEFRRDSQTLTLLYTQLDAAKLSSANSGAGGVANGHGPRLPCSTWALDTDVDLSSKLHELVSDAATTITPGRAFPHDGAKLATWLAFHAEACTRLDWADDLHQEIRDQCNQLNRLLNPAGIAEIAARPERRQTARSICAKLSSMGHKATPELLRQWAHRGHITSLTRADGKNTYLLTEVMERLTKASRPLL